MAVKRAKSAAAFTLVEVMITVLILSVAVIGASSYRYYAALDARKAAVQATAARMGLTLCESWRGLGGTETFDPIAYFGSSLTISAIGQSIEPDDATFTLLGGYTVVSEGVNYYAVLSWKDVSTELRALNIVVAWPQRGQAASSIADADKSFKLTTYTSL